MDAARCLRAARRVVVFTGAGISAESGIPTFRDSDGFWNDFPPEKFATAGGLVKAALAEPGRLVEFVLAVVEPIAVATPSSGHRAIAEMEAHVSTTVVTQNIDELHQDAGSTVVHEIHGTLFDIVSMNGRFLRRISRPELRRMAERLRAIHGGRLPLPRLLVAIRSLAGLGLRGGHRPAIVLFGEELAEPDWREWRAGAKACDVMLVVGTSAMVYPAAELPDVARSAGAKVIWVDPHPPSDADIRLPDKAGEVLPRLVEAAFGGPATG